MSREFNNGVITDLMTYDTTDLDIGPGAWTMLIVARVMETNDAVWISFYEGDNTGGANPSTSMGRTSGGDIYSASDALSSSVAWTDADNWCVIAATKAAGSVAPTHYKIPIGGVTTTAPGTAAIGNNNPTDRLRLGGPTDPAWIRLAVVALWNSVLSQANIESIASTKTTQFILDLAPLWCVDDSDSFATDLVGSVDRTAINGTTDNADDPTEWSYFGGGGGGDEPPVAFRHAGRGAGW